ncbi:hypothetical protein IJG14_08275, partial [bacterium]|nr:hypothetical protein [bacterium]
DFDRFTTFASNNLPLYQDFDIKDFIFLLFSQTTLNHSFLKLISKLDNNNDIVLRSINPRVRYTDWYTRRVNEQNFYYLKQILNLLEQKNIKYILYTEPYHAYTLVDIYKQNVYKYMEEFKKELALITPFYDFEYIGKYSEAPISLENPYWHDPIHSTSVLGKEMLEKMIYNKGDFGVYVTENNINNHLEKQKKELIQYMNTHVKEIEKFLSYGHIDMYTIKECK